MELRVKLATDERGKESGNGRRETLLRKVGMGGMGNSAFCAQPGTADEALVLWFGRSCAKTCRPTFESGWMASGS